MPTLNNLSNVAKCGALTVALLAMFVALNAALALVNPKFAAAPSKAGLEPEPSRVKAWRDYSFFVDQSKQRSLIIDRQSQSLLEPLEFMVWPNTRKHYSSAYSQSLQQQINLQPFNAELWSQLVYAQSEAKLELDQQLWTMRRTFILTRWNLRNRALITRPCVVDYPRIMSDYGETICSELLASLHDEKSVEVLAKQLGVRPQSLLTVLVELGFRNQRDQAQ